MAYLSHLYLPGALALWCAVFFALASLWGYSLVLRGDESARAFARRAYGFFALSIVLTAAVLLLLLVRRDFRIEYVYQYSGMDLPWFYQLSAFWAGQKGSFLIWLFWGSLIGLLLYRTTGRRQEAPVMGVYTLTLMGLLFILVRENPFIMLNQTPVDGSGLNPLLQDNWMVIHPPIMFIGYALAAVPFSFAMAALWRREYDGWARRAFPWALAGFMILGCAILMGGYWAYKTLGWGGYWGWDPVENASLIPWLFGVVLIHGLHMERAKGRYRRANVVISSLVYLSVLYGTFLTRSGVLADFSVHSFVDLGISRWLVTFMATFVLMAVLLIATRIREIPTGENADPFLSRGTFMVLATITVLVSAFVITIGTSSPLLTRAFLKNPAQAGPEFYNQVNLPIAMLVALLLSFVPFLTWRGETVGTVLRKMIVPGLLALGVCVGAWWFGVHDPFHLLFIFLATTALVTNMEKTYRRAKVGGLRSAGGYLSHVGVGVILLGIIASSAYDQSTKVTLTQGVPQKVGDSTLTFVRFLPRTAHEKERMEVKVQRQDGSAFLVYPKFFVNDRTKQVMVNPDIRSSLLQDLYVSPLEFNPGEPAGAPRSFQLAKGESAKLGDLDIRFAGFDLNAGGVNAMAAMAAGQPMTIGATLEITDGKGNSHTVLPLYRFSPGGQVEMPPMALPDGGYVRVGGINAADGKVEIQTVGVGPAAEGKPAKLSLDVTKKPLIGLVWYGLYIILFGGALATYQRLRESKIRDRLARATAAGPTPPKG